MSVTEEALQRTLHALYNAHHGWLYTWLRKRLGCSHSAADLAQDTFVRLIDSGKADTVREPRAYLTTVARGLMVDHYRRADLEHAYLAGLAALPESLHPSPEELALVVETLHELARMLGGLSKKTREAYLCSRVEGMTHAEIAARLGVSIPRIRQYLTTAARQCYLLRYGTPLS